jgi:hypothetical protein
VLDDLVDPSLYLSEYPRAIKPRLHEFDLPAIQALYAAVDIIGGSVALAGRGPLHLPVAAHTLTSPANG